MVAKLAALLLPLLAGYVYADCPSGFTPYLDYCVYAQVVDADSYSYQDAVNECNSLNAQLPSIHSYDENNGLYHTVCQSTGYPECQTEDYLFWYWIGLQCSGSNYYWSDGTAYDYNDFFGSGDDLCTSGNHATVMDERYDNAWSVYPDYSDWDVIVCTTRNGTGGQTTTPSGPTQSTTTGAPGSCPDGFYNFQDYCVYTALSDSDSYSYQDADAMCSSLGATLPSVHSYQENNALYHSVCNATGYPQCQTDFYYFWYWIGLECNDSNNFYWEDGTAYDYNDFSSSGQQCVSNSHAVVMDERYDNSWSMYADSIEWDIVVCTKRPTKKV